MIDQKVRWLNWNKWKFCKKVRQNWLINKWIESKLWKADDCDVTYSKTLKKSSH